MAGCFCLVFANMPEMRRVLANTPCTRHLPLKAPSDISPGLLLIDDCGIICACSLPHAPYNKPPYSFLSPLSCHGPAASYIVPVCLSCLGLHLFCPKCPLFCLVCSSCCQLVKALQVVGKALQAYQQWNVCNKHMQACKLAYSEVCVVFE